MGWVSIAGDGTAWDPGFCSLLPPRFVLRAASAQSPDCSKLNPSCKRVLSSPVPFFSRLFLLALHGWPLCSSRCADGRRTTQTRVQVQCAARETSSSAELPACAEPRENEPEVFLWSKEISLPHDQFWAGLGMIRLSSSPGLITAPRANPPCSPHTLHGAADGTAAPPPLFISRLQWPLPKV